MRNTELVKIVIPIYKPHPDNFEKISLKRCFEIFNDIPIVFIKPSMLNIKWYANNYPKISYVDFEDDYFNGIAGYNRLMLSPDFYEKFLDSEYILIYQLDAFAFRNELTDWCNKGYDYVGAPWILKPKYHKWYMKAFLRVKSINYKIKKRPFAPLFLGDKVGNGGFSLRKVLPHYNSAKNKTNRINYFLECSNKFSEYNEDAFWALENREFRYPCVNEALLFSIDNYPEICFKMNDSKLPFGCHGWSKPDKIDFWKSQISLTQ